MTRIKLSKYFYADELIDPRTYFNEVNHGIGLIDIHLLDCLDFIREKANKPLYINTWWKYYDINKDATPLDVIIFNIEENASLRKASGFRGKFCNVGAKFSAHRKGKAADLKGATPKELEAIVRANTTKLYNLGLRRIEDIKITPTWFHLDTWDKNSTKGIEVVDLKKVVEVISL